MGIIHKRVGSTCERCGNIASKELKVTHYTENDNDLLLCDECISKDRKEIDEIIEKDKKARAIKCQKCNGFVWQKGGLVNYKDEKICKECHIKINEKFVKRERQKDFLKKNWHNWIFIGIAIAGLLIARELI